MKRDPLRCGECGNNSFTMAHARPDTEGEIVGGHGSGFLGALIVTCIRCSTETKIEAVPAALTADGPLCGGWRS